MEDPKAEVDAALAQPTRAEQAKALADVLKAIPDFASHVKELRRDVVRQMHTEDEMSWAEIAEATGLHRTRVAQISRGIPGGGKKKPSPAEADEG